MQLTLLYSYHNISVISSLTLLILYQHLVKLTIKHFTVTNLK